MRTIMEYRVDLTAEVVKKMNVCRNEVFEAIELAADSLVDTGDQDRVVALQEQVDGRIDSLIKEIGDTFTADFNEWE